MFGIRASCISVTTLQGRFEAAGVDRSITIISSDGRRIAALYEAKNFLCPLNVLLDLFHVVFECLHALMINGVVSGRYVDIARGCGTSGWSLTLQSSLGFSMFWLVSSIVAIMIWWRVAIDCVCKWHGTNLCLSFIRWLKLLVHNGRAIVLTTWYHLIGQRLSIDWNRISLYLMLADNSSAVHLTSWYISEESVLATGGGTGHRVWQRFDVLSIWL